MSKIHTSHQNETEIPQEIDSSAFATAVEQAQIDFTPAFVHGLLTAYCSEEVNSHGWVTLLTTALDPNHTQQTNQLRYLNQVKNTIATQLSDSELSFQLLLHNTAGTLHDEVLLTKEWASGYWLGVEKTQLNERVDSDALSREFLADLTQVIAMPLPSEDDLDNSATGEESYTDNYDSSGEIYDNDSDDDTHADILQIQEYCRAGAIGVFLASWSD